MVASGFRKRAICALSALSFCAGVSNAFAKSVSDINSERSNLKSFVNSIEKMAETRQDFSTALPDSMERARKMSDYIAGPDMKYVQSGQVLKNSYNFTYNKISRDDGHPAQNFCESITFGFVYSSVSLVCYAPNGLNHSRLVEVLGNPIKKSRGPYWDAHGMFPAPDDPTLYDYTFQIHGIDFVTNSTNEEYTKILRVSFIAACGIIKPDYADCPK
jgi:hypothetical protein